VKPRLKNTKTTKNNLKHSQEAYYLKRLQEVFKEISIEYYVLAHMIQTTQSENQAQQPM